AGKAVLPMNLRIFESVDDLVAAAARAVMQCVARTEGTVAIGLSGGSTPKPLYELLGREPDRGQLAERDIIWVVVDERWVPADDPQSNARMIQETLFAGGIPPRHTFLQFRTAEGEPAESARDFEAEWRELGIADLDLVLLGVGDDGHTASLFPDTPVLDVEDRIAAEVFVPRLQTWRVTITKPVIRAARSRIVLAAGASKKRILEEVRKGVKHPIALVAGEESDTWWFIDRTAAPE
ncbi:MAG TPA: 6-phosphogluconolactonase, partial [Thermoanaerobaculia bacterium]|nr:6-phosphogluconolactonase [Thermoanaerobaculia bacterium]